MLRPASTSANVSHRASYQTHRQSPASNAPASAEAFNPTRIQAFGNFLSATLWRRTGLHTGTSNQAPKVERRGSLDDSPAGDCTTYRPPPIEDSEQVRMPRGTLDGLKDVSGAMICHEASARSGPSPQRGAIGRTASQPSLDSAHLTAQPSGDDIQQGYYVVPSAGLRPAGNLQLAAQAPPSSRDSTHEHPSTPCTPTTGSMLSSFVSIRGRSSCAQPTRNISFSLYSLNNASELSLLDNHEPWQFDSPERNWHKTPTARWTRARFSTLDPVRVSVAAKPGLPALIEVQDEEGSIDDCHLDSAPPRLCIQGNNQNQPKSVMKDAANIEQGSLKSVQFSEEVARYCYVPEEGCSDEEELDERCVKDEDEDDEEGYYADEDSEDEAQTNL